MSEQRQHYTEVEQTMDDVHSESEFEATAIHDGSADFYLRLSRLVPDLNVLQLDRLAMESNGRRLIPLGIRTNSVGLPDFMRRAELENLTIELKAV